MAVSRKARPVKTKRSVDINPVNLEKIFDHFDKEIAKVYNEIGDGGSISRQVIVGGGSSGGGGSSVNETELKQYALLSY